MHEGAEARGDAKGPTDKSWQSPPYKTKTKLGTNAHEVDVDHARADAVSALVVCGAVDAGARRVGLGEQLALPLKLHLHARPERRAPRASPRAPASSTSTTPAPTPPRRSSNAR